MDREELRNTMTRMNEHPEDIARWCSREILWNGERITVREPASWPINQEDEE